ncbi:MULTISPECIES: hypothetical protein [Bradyrhizobium]|uniref:Uncharacterized protein n=2 Tax=Bradyrhizobium TaxID=374 RepID=A0ABY0P5N1_9BRAD|nr:MULTISPECIES: hypothetical protein [Bradyrhizobium]SDH42053.1 hypothetical protein SAMN05444163_0101 [Bradyrhizobium ottawaense]SEE33258.1 hypothetical protein SAMN05444171_7067 [Bradyrhizobium lablabi]SHM29764.1 hypothetical protein SAMN05444321_5876 [Bradyrhizobium lablabi]
MGNGNIDVGNQTPTRKPGQPAVELTSGRSGSSEQRVDSSMKTEPPCGAMSQQGGEFRGNLSAPQKFVHLVGCREPKVRGSEVRQYSNPAKR